MVNLKDMLPDGAELGKVFTGHGKAFKVTEDSEMINLKDILREGIEWQGILVKDEVAINPNKKICTETLNALKESNIIWRGQTTTLATLDQLKHAADSGCLELAIGVETADENVMKLIDKTWQDRKQILDFAKNARKVGIKIKVCLILGLPGEPRDIVKKTINLGNLSTFNCPEEVELAKKLVSIHPWSQMVKFTRSGGEANALAIRIARAAVGKDNVAVCGYHGWHDWYLSANHGARDQLHTHLLPGLEPKGVPQGLQNTIFTFQYNDFQTLQSLVETKNIGVIKMEVRRNIEPQNEFLQKVRKLASDKNLVLIFDECTSGFRETFGGLHLKYGVYPDMAIFGKALGNGHAITAVIGIRNIMEEAQNTFISSTFWTERSGPVAALATLEEMEKIKSWEIITKIGHKIKSSWQHLADKHSLEIEQWGLPSLAGFTILSPHKMIYKTYITQELLKKGYLGANSVYACIAHNDTVLQNYFEELDPIFEKIKRCEDGLYSVNDLLEDQVCESGFGRLN